MGFRGICHPSGRRRGPDDAIPFEDARTCRSRVALRAAARRRDPSEEKPRRTWLVIVGTVAAVLCLMLGTCAVLVARAVSVQGMDLTPLVDGHLTKIAAGDYHGAYADCGNGFQSATKEADYERFEGGVHDRLGKIVSKTVKTAQSGTGTGGSWAHTIYDCQFEKSPGTIDFKFHTGNGVWKIVGIHYNAPVLDDALKRQ